MSYKENWLPSLNGAVPESAKGHTMSTYAIALEGWRRGLILKFHHIYDKKEKRVRLLYSLSSKTKTHKFSVSRGDKVSKMAIKTCINKDLTKKVLLDNKVDTPRGELYGESNSDEEIIEAAAKYTFPLVIKPADGKSGKGVVVDLKDNKELKEALYYVRQKLRYKNIILEEYVKGEDCRIYVINDKVIGAITRVPAHVIGDGKHSIKELINLKNKERDANPNLANRYIKIDDELIKHLQKQNVTLEAVPKAGENINIKNTSNVSSGGEPIDVTDQLADEVKQTAVDACKSIPGLVQGSIDMLVDFENDKGWVIEINSKPQIGSHLFPNKGLPRNVPKEIIDYYFPETNKDSNQDFYFDFDSITNIIKSGVAKEVQVRKIPSYKLIKHRFLFKVEDIQEDKFTNWLRLRALKIILHGEVNKTNEGEIELIVGGTSGRITQFETELRKKTEEAEIEILSHNEFSNAVMMGFRVNF